MAKQKHDIGWKKRQANTEPPTAISCETLARRLVSRGLVSVNVLDRSLKPKEDQQ